jgi:aspartate carbamoyltransferase catalytic subunit
MLGNIRYITATIAKENTTVDTIKTMADADVDILIVQAQLMID